MDNQNGNTKAYVASTPSFEERLLRDGGMNEIETFYGLIETTADSLRIVELCRQGKLGRVSRRLHDKERKLIRSGSVFVFDETESGIKRWTDGRVWSPSRILGNFLIYRELERKPFDEAERTIEVEEKTDDWTAEESFSFHKDAELASLLPWLSEPFMAADHSKDEDQMELLKSSKLLNNHKGRYVFKNHGLIKKTISIKIDGHPHHLVCYYSKKDFCQGHLGKSSFNDTLMNEIRKIPIPPEILAQQNFRKPTGISMDIRMGPQKPISDIKKTASKRRSSYPGAIPCSKQKRAHDTEMMMSGFVPIAPALENMNEFYPYFQQPPSSAGLTSDNIDLLQSICGDTADLQYQAQAAEDDDLLGFVQSRALLTEEDAFNMNQNEPPDSPNISLEHPRGLKWSSWLLSPDYSQLNKEPDFSGEAPLSPMFLKDPMLPVRPPSDLFDLSKPY